MNKSSVKKEQRTRRHGRIRARITGTATRPRFAVFRSNKFVYAQLIDDTTGTTLAHTDSRKVDGKTQLEKAVAVGTEIAKQAKAKKIDTVVFDRGGFLYAGKIKALADAAREGGLTF